MDTAPASTPTPPLPPVPAAVSAHCTQQRHKQGKGWQNKEAFRRWQTANSNRIIPVQAGSRYKHTVPSFSNKTQPRTPGSFLQGQSKHESVQHLSSKLKTYSGLKTTRRQTDTDRCTQGCTHGRTRKLARKPPEDRQTDAHRDAGTTHSFK